MKRILQVFLLTFFISFSAFAGIKQITPTKECYSSFVIVVDKATYDKVQNEILLYRDALQEEDNLATYILVVDSETPEKIKEELKKLYQTNIKLEGSVFVGDIPITMIRGAQHMTSAFKMNEEKYDWIDSSVPSDRFYEDFDLKFNYLEQDSSNALLYYYLLRPDSPQIIRKDIYSGRIKAPVSDESKYVLLKEYLGKVVKEKKSPQNLDNAFVFTGHGYNSEALTGWNDEMLSLREQFPQMFKVGGQLKGIYYSMSPNIKETVFMELSRPELDLAIFHAHGAEDTQYLTGYPPAESVQGNIEWIKRFLRSKLRYAQKRHNDSEKAIKYYKDKYNFPDEWFEGAFVDSVVTADSLFDYKMDIHSDDLALFSPQAEFIMFDECFNGSFHLDNSISARYIFGSGNAISSVANSVNVLQDKWANKSIGLLGYGVRVGNWHKEVNYLENHIIGDPTFHYKNNYEIDLNKKIVDEKKNKVYWESLLNNSSSELRSLAIVKLSKILKNEFIPQLLEIYKTDESYIVRMHVLASLAATNSKEFEDFLLISINDPYEFIRRKSAELLGEINSDRYLNEMLNSMIYDQSKRVSFNIGNSLLLADQSKLMDEANKILDELPAFVDKEKYKRIFRKTAERGNRWVYDDILPKIQDDTLKYSKRLSAIRTLRNYKFDQAVPVLFNLFADENVDEKLKLAAVETLGWYYYSDKRFDMIEKMNEIIDNQKTSKKLKDEALKTKNRLVDGANVSITP